MEGGERREERYINAVVVFNLESGDGWQIRQGTGVSVWSVWSVKVI